MHDRCEVLQELRRQQVHPVLQRNVHTRIGHINHEILDNDPGDIAVDGHVFQLRAFQHALRSAADIDLDRRPRLQRVRKETIHQLGEIRKQFGAEIVPNFAQDFQISIKSSLAREYFRFAQLARCALVNQP